MLGRVPDRFLMPLFVALWSSGYVVGAVALGSADPLPVLAVRFTLASLVAVPLALRGRDWRDAPLGRLAGGGPFLQGPQFGGAHGGPPPRGPAGPGAPPTPRPSPPVSPRPPGAPP